MDFCVSANGALSKHAFPAADHEKLQSVSTTLYESTLQPLYHIDAESFFAATNTPITCIYPSNLQLHADLLSPQ